MEKKELEKKKFIGLFDTFLIA
jgi:hypothetical protein